ncbi:MAG: putative metal-binding motif-containing protein, partial [Deltaproteobacteria bacterium]|nr:putative metal-binding motif-containing protein [Deltaproteobacteria bacterium]
MTRPLILCLGASVLAITFTGCGNSRDEPDDTNGADAVDVDKDGYPTDVDCDDEDADVHPDADEVCDGKDNDCDEEIDEDVLNTYYRDADSDGFGDPTVTEQACTRPDGYVTINTDCDDADASSHPGGKEICDERDNDCDEEIDEGVGTLWYYDGDGDGYGDPKKGVLACECPPDHVADQTDCDDLNASVYPSAEEICDGLDNDCDVEVDEDAGWPLATDGDGDGFGEPGSTRIRCEGVDNEWDCDDRDPSEPVVVDVATGSPSGAGTLSSPLDTIQAGVDLALGCVVVFPGTYYEAVHLGGDITLTGVEGAASTFVDASGHELPVLTIDQRETAATVVSGFTLTGGAGYLTRESSSYSCGCGETCTDWYYTYCGGGVYVSGASPTLQDLFVLRNTLPEYDMVVEDNDTYYTYSFGGGVCLLSSDSVLTGVDVWQNYAFQGGGLYTDESSTITFAQGSIAGNTASNGAGWQVDGSVASLTNVVSLINEATREGGGLYLVDATSTVVNASYAGDSAVLGGGLYASGTSSLTVLNSIVYATGDGEGVLVDGGSRFEGAYNDVFGNAGGNYSGTDDPTGTDGNISSNPYFTTFTDDGDPTDDSLVLTSRSPCINTGDPAAAYNDPDGSRNDMGAYGGP